MAEDFFVVQKKTALAKPSKHNHSREHHLHGLHSVRGKKCLLLRKCFVGRCKRCSRSGYQCRYCSTEAMRRIKEYAEHITDELCGAKEYAEKYLYEKAKSNSQRASRYKEMAGDELKHAEYIHTFAVQEIEMLEKSFEPPESMLEAWNKSHREYVEQAAWIRQMLSL